MIVVPDLATLRPTPWRERTALVHGRLRQRARPRADRRWIRATSCAGRSSAARSAASSPVLATEIEFYLTDAETGKPVYDGIQCYSLQKGAELEHVVGHIRRVIEAYGIVVEASNTEYGPAQVEINFGHGAADRGLRRHGRLQVGRARDRAQPRPARDVHGQAVPRRLGQRAAPAPQPAQGRRERVRAGHRRRQPLGNASMRHWVAGLATHAAQIALLANPTVNAYKRIEDYSFAPTRVSWGLDNRNVAVRCIPQVGAGLARRVPRRRRRRQPLPARGRRAGGRHGRDRARAGAAADGRARRLRRRAPAAPAALAAAPRSRPGRRRRSRARRSASASPTTTRASPATTRRSTTRPSPTGKRSATGSSHSLVATRAAARPTTTVDDRRDTCLREALAA